ncbi:unnamed protein product, partial [Ilex paraguariensis]
VRGRIMCVRCNMQINVLKSLIELIVALEYNMANRVADLTNRFGREIAITGSRTRIIVTVRIAIKAATTTRSRKLAIVGTTVVVLSKATITMATTITTILL